MDVCLPQILNRTPIRKGKTMSTKIKTLDITNVGPIKTARITNLNNKTLVVVGGQNASGKSTVLNAISMALCGAKHDIDVPIHEGEAEARIVLETEQFTVSVVYTKKGRALQIKERPGFVKPKGGDQSFLNNLLGAPVDPLEFTRLKPDEQVKVIAELAGIDVDAVQEKIKDLETERRIIGREVTSKEGALQQFDIDMGDDEIPSKLIDTAELTQKLREANQHNRQADELKYQLERLNTQTESLTNRAKQLQDEYKQVRASLEECNKTGEALNAQISAFKFIETESIEHQINNATAINKRIEQSAERERMGAEAKQLKDQYDNFTLEINKLKASLTEIDPNAVKVPGLQIGDGCILLNGLPFTSASSAEQIKTSLAIAASKIGDCRVLTIKDGSLLDDNSFEYVRQFAEENDLLVLVEVVGNGDRADYIIREGKAFKNHAELNEEIAKEPEAGSQLDSFFGGIEIGDLDDIEPELVAK